MSINVTTVSEYIKQNENDIKRKAIVESKTASYPGVVLQTGVKSKEKLNYISSDVAFQDGKSCGWIASGETTLTQREIVVGKLKLQEAYCEKDLIGKFLEYGVKIEAGLSNLPAEQQFMDARLDAIKAVKDSLIWQSKLSGGTGNYQFFDGLIEVIDNSGLAVEANPSVSGVTGLTSANIIDVVYDMVGHIPANILSKEDLVLFMGDEIFNMYNLALTKANLYHVQPDAAAGKTREVAIPGSNVKAVAVQGLNLTNRMFLTYASNIVIGTDLEGSDEKIDFWYSQDNREFRLEICFALGTQVFFPDAVVEFTLTA